MKNKLYNGRKVQNRHVMFCLLLFIVSLTYAQVGIGNTDPKATLDITASSQTEPSDSDGILIPRVDKFPTLVIPGSDQNGMLVYLTTDLTIATVVYQKGFYYWDNLSTNWIGVGSVKKINDLSDGKSDVDGSQDGSSVFIGIDAGAADNSSNNQSVGVGFNALMSNVNGSQISAFGYNALSLNTASHNSAFGSNALGSNIDGRRNVAIGKDALAANDANNNTAVGNQALKANTSGINNTAVGLDALVSNVLGNRNSAFGTNALKNSNYATTPFDANNSAFGFNALIGLTTGVSNVAIGTSSGGEITSAVTGSENTLIGYQSGFNLEAGSNNVYIGSNSGRNTPDGNSNVFIGKDAGNNAIFNAVNNTLIIQNTSGVAPLIYGDFDAERVGINKVASTHALEVEGTTEATQFKLSALNTAPTSASDTGTVGEIRVVANRIYICIATDTWVRSRTYQTW